MTVYKCKMCDAILHVLDNEDIVTCEYCGTQQSIQEAHVAQTEKDNQNNLNTDALLKRAFMFLEEKDFDRAEEYCEKVLDLDPECAEAYLGKLMADLHVSKQEKLKDCKEPFDDHMNYKRFMQFAKASLAETIAGYSTYISERNEAARKEAIYQGAVADMHRVHEEYDYRLAAKAFESISGYKDSAERAKECLELAQEAYQEKRERDQKEWEERQRKAKEKKKIAIISVVTVFLTIMAILYWDREISPSIKLNKAITFIEEKDYENAYRILENLDYKNSKELLVEIAPIIYEERLSGLHVGDTVFFGVGDYSNRLELDEIEWLVLDEEDGRYLLLSKYALTEKYYNNRFDEVNWTSCSLRQWLNDEFVENSFNSYELSLIEPVFIRDEEQVRYDFSDGLFKKDPIFLLSKSEVYQYELNSSYNLCKGMPHLGKTDGEYFNWWIRSLGEPAWEANYVSKTGEIEDDYVIEEDITVRPALWISVE